MNSKLLCFDVDGTLRDNTVHKISMSTLNSIKHLRNNTISTQTLSENRREGNPSQLDSLPCYQSQTKALQAKAMTH